MLSIILKNNLKLPNMQPNCSNGGIIKHALTKVFQKICTWKVKDPKCVVFGKKRKHRYK